MKGSSRIEVCLHEGLNIAEVASGRCFYVERSAITVLHIDSLIKQNYTIPSHRKIMNSACLWSAFIYIHVQCSTFSATSSVVKFWKRKFETAS